MPRPRAEKFFHLILAGWPRPRCSFRLVPRPVPAPKPQSKKPRMTSRTAARNGAPRSGPRYYAQGYDGPRYGYEPRYGSEPRYGFEQGSRGSFAWAPYGPHDY